MIVSRIRKPSSLRKSAVKSSAESSYLRASQYLAMRTEVLVLAANSSAVFVGHKVCAKRMTLLFVCKPLREMVQALAPHKLDFPTAIATVSRMSNTTRIRIEAVAKNADHSGLQIFAMLFRALAKHHINFDRQAKLENLVEDGFDCTDAVWKEPDFAALMQGVDKPVDAALGTKPYVVGHFLKRRRVAVFKKVLRDERQQISLAAGHPVFFARVKSVFAHD